MRALGIALIVLVAGAILLQMTAVTGAWWLRGRERHDDQIAWLEAFRPVLPWDGGLDGHIGTLYRERVRRDLDAGRLDLAVRSLRKARSRAGHAGEALDLDLMALGIETYTRAADRMEAQGRLDAAAAWDDSLFTLAIRARQPHHRYAARAAFQEAIDLRVRNGEPCQALARVEWARRGLGGEIPGFQPSIEEDLRIQCAQSRGLRRR